MKTPHCFYIIAYHDLLKRNREVVVTGSHQQQCTSAPFLMLPQYLQIQRSLIVITLIINSKLLFMLKLL
jgi:hypothetical protein